MPSKFLPTVRNLFAGSAGLYLRALLAAIAAVALFFVASYGATFIDRKDIVVNLEAANARQAFTQTWAKGTGRAIPRFGGNDCLFFETLLQEYPSRLAQAISARIPPADAQPAARPGDPTIPACLQLIAALERPDHTDPNVIYYHRYLHGQRVIAALALAIMSPEALGWITLLANVICLLAVLLPALRRWRSGLRERGFAAIAATLSLFDGLWLFGIYFSFGLSDLVLSAFLAYVYYSGIAHAPERGFAGAAALFGATTAIFEFLTGGIPFGLALLLGIVAIDGPADRIAMMRRALHGTVIFGLAILVAFAIKLALVMLLIEPNVLAEFRSALATRTGSSFSANLPPQEIAWVSAFGIDVASLDRHWGYAVLYMLARLGYATFVIGYGSPVVGMIIMAAAVAITAVLLIRRLRACRDNIAQMRLIILLGSALVMPVWSLVFLSHTLLHAIWMVRPFAWFIALAGILLWWQAPRAAFANRDKSC